MLCLCYIAHAVSMEMLPAFGGIFHWSCLTVDPGTGMGNHATWPDSGLHQYQSMEPGSFHRSKCLLKAKTNLSMPSWSIRHCTSTKMKLRLAVRCMVTNPFTSTPPSFIENDGVQQYNYKRDFEEGYDDNGRVYNYTPLQYC